jgi:phosphate transport system permease protein
MSLSLLLAAILLLSLAGFAINRQRVAALAGSGTATHSRPSYHGTYALLTILVVGLGLTVLWLVVEPAIGRWLLHGWLGEADQALPADQLSLLVNDIINKAGGSLSSQNLSAEQQAALERYAGFRSTARWAMAAVVLAICGFMLWRAIRSARADFRARNGVERIVTWLMIVCSTIAVVTTFGIVLSLIFESLRFFDKVPFFDFIFGLDWSPQTAIRSDQVGSTGSFGAIPLIAGTLLISAIAMLVAVPVGLFAAIYMSEYASARMRGLAKPALEVLAGIPTVVYGFFAALTVAPFIKDTGGLLGLDVASESALAAGLVMGIMIIPFISSLSDDVMNAVPQTLRDGAYALGATRSETIRQVILPAALPGIVGAVLLGASRAIGETMIVVMAAGLAANLTINPLEAVTTVTVQIKTILVGDQEFDSAKTLSAFALGLLLFAVTLALNFVALRIVRKYREKYD